MKLSRADWTLAILLVAYVIVNVLLTPLGGFETRDPARVTVVGFVALGLLFVGLALSIIALVLLFRGSGRAPMFAIISTLLYFPAFLAEVTGAFSSLRPPIAIERLELLQLVVVLLALGVSSWLLRRGTSKERL
ncbi:MAG TPA: hypothetical protein VHJ99_08355 [Candidatus Dormibacteraeota bacterium]|nr:hypothetical protein [Candidatus Dormibacteraeota bacterium]